MQDKREPIELRIGGASMFFTAITYANVILVAWSVQLLTAAIALAIVGHWALGWIDSLVLSVAAIVGWVAWQNINPLRAVVRPTYFISLVLALLAIVAFMNVPDYSTYGTDESLFDFLPLFALCGLALIGIGASRVWLIEGLRISISTLLDRLRSLGRQRGKRPAIPPRNALRGYAVGCLGIAWLVGLQLFSDNEFVRSVPHLWLSGYGLLLVARRDIEPSADARHGGDLRSTILLLRAFKDDEYAERKMLADLTFLDYSLEARLADHFSQFGPFIAVSNPKAIDPLIGAARYPLPMDGWQSQVLRWLDDAYLTVFIAGRSEGVGWEFLSAIQRGHATKILVLFPKDRTWFSHRRSAKDRLNKLSIALQGTPWAQQLAEVARPEEIRSLVFLREGRVLMVRSHSKNRNTYHLAALAAHYVLVKSGQIGVQQT